MGTCSAVLWACSLQHLLFVLAGVSDCLACTLETSAQQECGSLPPVGVRVGVVCRLGTVAGSG